MAWTTPNTWSINDVVTASDLNTHLRDNLNFVNDFHGARVYNSAAISIPTEVSNIWTPITFNSERFDTDSFHDTASNTSRLTIPTGFAGKYLFFAHMVWDAAHTGSQADIRFLKNGTIAFASHGYTATSGSKRQLLVSIREMADSDYVEVEVQHNHGSSINIITNGNQSLVFGLARLGA